MKNGPNAKCPLFDIKHKYQRGTPKLNLFLNLKWNRKPKSKPKTTFLKTSNSNVIGSHMEGGSKEPTWEKIFREQWKANGGGLRSEFCGGAGSFLDIRNGAKTHYSGGT